MLSKLDKQDTIKSNCQTLPSKGRSVFQNFPTSENSLSDILSLYTKLDVPKITEKKLGDCPGSRLFLSFLAFFGSRLLVLPPYSGNIIFLLRSLMGLKTR